MNLQELNLMWGKTDRGNPPDENNKKAYRPVLYHLLDVAAITKALWEKMPSHFKSKCEDNFSMNQKEIIDFFCFIAALHDIGKISPGFQQKNNYLAQRLEDKEYSLENFCDNHAWISADMMYDFFVQHIKMDKEKALAFAMLLGGHHGTYPVFNEFEDKSLCINDDYSKWKTVREEAVELLFELFNKPNAANIKIDIGFMFIFSGLLSFADWLASSQQFFPVQYINVAPEDYFEEAKQEAMDIVNDLEWSKTPDKLGDVCNFNEMFPFEPNDMQQISIDMDIKKPCIIIIEGPTGEGKTEAAEYLAYRCINELGQYGFYIGEPTQATANAMFERVNGFLDHLDSSNFNLIHGCAHIDKKYQAIKNLNAENKAWFAQSNKKALLAPYGIGTIDQVLLSVLLSRYFFMRFFGLFNKVIIFDEIHAFDVYTSTILERLIEWLSAIDCTVILLSATLPKNKRNALLEAYRGQQQCRDNNCIQFNDEVKYPSVIHLEKGEDVAVVKNFESTPRAIGIKRINNNNFGIAQMLNDKLSNGGCAAYICNTVGKAQEVYSDLKKYLDDDTALYIFHARFPYCEREKIEKEIIHKFGKNGQRPHKAVVVATQVIEQSLDIDFDLMISEYAPIDLLIQRMGRIHRHEMIRPSKLVKPAFYLVKPKMSRGGIPEFTNKIYSSYILLKSWLSLIGKNNISLPGDTEQLIECVYDNDNDNKIINKHPNIQPILMQKKKETQNKIKYLKNHAEKYLLGHPTFEDGFPDFINQKYSAFTNEPLDPTIPAQLRAQTRYSEYPGIKVIILETNDCGQICVRTDSGLEPINIHEPLTFSDVNKLYKSHTVLYGHDVVEYFADKTFDTWKENYILKYCRAAKFNKNKEIKMGNVTIKLDKKMGIIIERE